MSPASAGPVDVKLGPADEVDRAADLGPVEEALAAHLVRDPRPGQRVLDRGELGVDPDEDGDLGRRDAVADQLARSSATRAVSSAASVPWRATTGSGPAGRVATRRFARPGRGQQVVGQREDLRGRSVVLRQRDVRAPGCRSAKPSR